jgi:hypothetical protein
MFRQTLACVFLLSPLLAGHAGVAGCEYGTLTEAKAMLARAVAAMKTDQPDAIAQFNHNDPEFRDRDLFVFCFNSEDGKFTAHEAMVTRDVRTFVDKNGTAYGQQMYDVASEGQVNEVDYMSPFPGSTRRVAKRAYIIRVGDQVCGVSAYRFEESSGSPGDW